MTVRADDLSAMDYNPAGLARLRGTRFYYSHRVVYSDIEYRRARTLDWSDATHGVPRLVDFEHVNNEVPWNFLGTMVALSSDFGRDDFTLAAGFYGPPAVGHYKFPRYGPQRYQMIEQDVLVLFYNLSGAWKYKDTFGLGVSLQWVDVPKFNFELVVDGNLAPRLVNPDQSSFDINTRVEGSDRAGFTTIVGAWWKPVANLEVAFAGRIIPIRIDNRSKLYLEADHLALSEPISITNMDGVDNNDVTFSMAFPIKLRMGVRYIHELARGRELFDVELGLHYERWSILDSYTMTADIVTEVAGQSLELNTVEITRNYQDTFQVRLGTDVNVVPGWLALRAGFAYETPAIPKGYEFLDSFSYHRLAPSAGFTLSLWKFHLSAAYTYVWQNVAVLAEEDAKVYQQVPGSPCQAPYTNQILCSEHYLGQPSAAVNAGTYKAIFHLLNASLSCAF